MRLAAEKLLISVDTLLMTQRHEKPGLSAISPATRTKVKEAYGNFIDTEHFILCLMLFYENCETFSCFHSMLLVATKPSK